VPASTAAGAAAAGSTGKDEVARQQERQTEEEHRYGAPGAGAERRGQEGKSAPHASRKPWCGPDFCYSEDGASCFEKYRADYCMHRVYVCMKNFFGGGDCKHLALGVGAIADRLSDVGDRLVQPEPPPPAEWSAAGWAAALSTALLSVAVAASAVSRASELLCRPAARGVDKSPLLG